MLAEMSEELKNFAQKYNVAINDPIGFARNEARQEGLAQGCRETNIPLCLYHVKALEPLDSELLS